MRTQQQNTITKHRRQHLTTCNISQNTITNHDNISQTTLTNHDNNFQNTLTNHDNIFTKCLKKKTSKAKEIIKSIAFIVMHSKQHMLVDGQDMKCVLAVHFYTFLARKTSLSPVSGLRHAPMRLRSTYLGLNIFSM